MKRLLIIMAILLTGAIAQAAPYQGSSGKEGLVVDRTTRDRTLNSYALLTRDLIQGAWKTPLELTATTALKGKVRVNYTIGRSGALESLELVRGSGNSEMDRTLLQAIRAASPFPRFPDEIAARSVTIRANFVVADLPTTPATRVEYRPDESSDAAATDSGQKKFMWGVPAETAHKKEPNLAKETPIPAPPAKKYRWGMER